MKLYLVRHGAAVPPHKDSSKPLTPEARTSISRLTRTLKSLDVRVSRIIHSGKLRAEETALIIAEGLEEHPRVESVQGLGPNDDVSPVAAMINALDEELMIVGHLPYLDNLLAELLGPQKTEKLPTFDCGTTVCLEKKADRWEIVRHLGPRMIL